MPQALDILLLVKLLLLLAVANGAPVLGQRLLDHRWRYPLDAGVRFFDGRPLLGRSKTIRGVVLSLMFTPLAGWAVGLGWRVGLVIAVFAMLGDLASSFIKRRMGMASSGMALGIDQIPESLFPLLAVQRRLVLTVDDILIVVALFLALELVLSQLLFWLRVRETPY